MLPRIFIKKTPRGDRLITQLLNSVIAKYRDLSVSRRSIICRSRIIDLLTTDKSRYFAQPRPIIVNYSTKKIIILQLASKFSIRVFRNIPISSVRMTLTMSKMFARIICQSIEWQVNYLSLKKSKGLRQVKIRFVLLFDQFSHSSSFCTRPYSPGCKPVKPGHCSVLRPRILRVLLTLPIW